MSPTDPAAIVASLPPDLVAALLVLAPVIDEIRRQQASASPRRRARPAPHVELPAHLTAERVAKIEADLARRNIR